MNGWIDGRMVAMVEWFDGCKNEYDGWMDELMNGIGWVKNEVLDMYEMDGRMVGWMSG